MEIYRSTTSPARTEMSIWREKPAPRAKARPGSCARTCFDDVYQTNNKKADFPADVHYYSPQGPDYDFVLPNCDPNPGYIIDQHPSKNIRIYFTKGSEALSMSGKNVPRGQQVHHAPGSRTRPPSAAKSDHSDSSMPLNTGGAKLFNDVMKEPRSRPAAASVRAGRQQSRRDQRAPPPTACPSTYSRAETTGWRKFLILKVATGAARDSESGRVLPRKLSLPSQYFPGVLSLIGRRRKSRRWPVSHHGICRRDGRQPGCTFAMKAQTLVFGIRYVSRRASREPIHCRARKACAQVMGECYSDLLLTLLAMFTTSFSNGAN